jgi:putative ABC transport system permease protein
MNYSKLILSALKRQRVRTALTIAGLAIAFLLLGLLQPVQRLFSMSDARAGTDRLVVLPKHSVTDFLTTRSANRVRDLAGVRAVAHQTWFGGTFRDPAQAFARWAVPPAEYLALHPEILLDVSAREAFIGIRTGAIVGRSTAEKYALRVGDTIPLIPDIWANKDGAHWEFQLVGIYDIANAAPSDMFINYQYFDEARVWGRGLVSSIIVGVDDPKSSTEVGRRIDALFANSDAETRTATEREYALSYASQIGNVGLIVTGILTAVFFTIAMLTANTLSQAIRERTAEFAVLRTLGFLPPKVFALILAEAFLVTGLGAAIGLLLARALIGSLSALSPQLAAARISVATFACAVALAACIALIAGLPPAWRACRLRIVDALRSH